MARRPGHASQGVNSLQFRPWPRLATHVGRFGWAGLGWAVLALAHARVLKEESEIPSHPERESEIVVSAAAAVAQNTTSSIDLQKPSALQRLPPVNTSTASVQQHSSAQLISSHLISILHPSVSSAQLTLRLRPTIYLYLPVSKGLFDSPTMETKMQLLNLLVVVLMATYLVSPVLSSRLLQSTPEAAADARSEEHGSLHSQEIHSPAFQQLTVDVHSAPAMTAPVTSYESTYQPDYETHDNSPGFNGRRR
ncbi:hypothetical protein Mp_1g20260 [Marchantia polymorpha subsp. ruderalis]|uniref:Uncharacterized protein n=2 Tax=Marchantia polymorpha TaxID=3197 RepID=A0AAF6AS75_MARPO|nr:hypothetical protein MARPO_0001s0363 [Marchantia polymorpha]BBM99295.1 hypothetical protein Mp_1g20260 [Marchantia polymorpha subsp. ruderalis]|eukprot:PTQ50377.1 hypothetical protein MARPO_0001s0363 [Marchantia polymorpha]